MSDTDLAATHTTGTDDRLKHDVARLGRSVGRLHDDLDGVVKGAGEVAQSGLVAAKERGRTTLGVARVSVRRRIAQHPGATVGIALGLGLIIGLVGPAIIRSRREKS